MIILEITFSGYNEIAKFLIRNGANCTIRDMNNRTALHTAVANGNFKTNSMAQVHYWNSLDFYYFQKKMASREAYASDDTELIEELIRRTGNVGLEDKDKRTALDYAAESGNLLTNINRLARL